MGETGSRTEFGLAEVVSGFEAVDLEAADGVSESDDAASPSLVEGGIGVAVRGEVRVVVVVGAVERLGVDDTGHRQHLGARSVPLLRVASITGHATYETILFGGPYGGLEGEALLGAN